MRSSYALSSRTVRVAGLLGAMLLGLAAAPVSATPIVVGSTYQFIVFEGAGSTSVNATATFDGVAETFAINPSGTVTVNESQTFLGGQSFQIDITLDADSDLYAQPAGNGNAFFNIGVFSNPLDLTGFFSYVSGVLSFFREDGSLIASSGFSATNPQPWDGFFTQPGVGVGFVGIADSQDIRGITVSIIVTPEPASLALLGLGLLGAGFARRR